MRTPLLSTVLVAALALASTSCVKKIILNGTIEGTRSGSGAFDTIGDYELARSAASAGLVQFEGMHRLAPDNTDALFMLVKGWTGYGFGFAQDDYDAATIAKDDAAAEYHRGRGKLAFDRAVFYGDELIGHYADGFQAAQRNTDTLKKWLDDNFDDAKYADVLFWVGYAWMARVNLLKDDDLVASLFVGVTLMEKSVALDPTYAHWSGTTALAAYHSRIATAEVDQSKQLFETALAKTARKNLLVQLNYASTYACVKGDQPLYEKLVNEVLAAEDPDPQQRLTNVIAKRKAKRALTKAKMEDCGFAAAPPPPKAASL